MGEKRKHEMNLKSSFAFFAFARLPRCVRGSACSVCEEWVRRGEKDAFIAPTCFPKLFHTRCFLQKYDCVEGMPCLGVPISCNQRFQPGRAGHLVWNGEIIQRNTCFVCLKMDRLPYFILNCCGIICRECVEDLKQNESSSDYYFTCLCGKKLLFSGYPYWLPEKYG